MFKKELEKLSKDELIEKLLQVEERFASSNVHAAELVMELEEANKMIQAVQKQAIHQAKLASIGELAAGTAHEINNPLTIALFNVQTLIKNAEKEGIDLGQKPVKIQNALERISEIVKGLSSYARARDGKPENFDLNKVIVEEVEFVRKLFEKEGIKLSVVLSEEPLFVEANLTEMRQVIVNLLNNAKHALEGQEAKEIKIQSLEIGKFIALEIADNGCGIPKQDLNRIFDMFYTTKEIGVGTGMGLGICSAIIRKAKGQISVESEEGEGSCFKITLPRSNQNHSLVTSHSEEKVSSLSGTVLAVDDESEIVEHVKAIVEEFGMTCDTEIDPLRALERLKQKNYTTLITDLRMPHLNGTELIKKAIEVDSNQNIVIITGAGKFSGNSEHDEVKKKYPCLAKPFKAQALYNILASFEKSIKKAS